MFRFNDTNVKEKADMSTKVENDPEISILIPVYNEETILEESVRDIIRHADSLHLPYELVICENGSRDRTVEIGEQLCMEFPQMRLLRCPIPDYGEALALGIRSAKGKNIVCFEIDFYDVNFIEIAHVLLKKYDAVIGSKRAVGARDQRPFIRRSITWGFNTFLRLFFGFNGTDTHGIKAFRLAPVLPIIATCQTRADLFTTELVLRIERAGLWRCEIPLEIMERRPAPINILRRVPRTITNLWTLWKTMRPKGGENEHIPNTEAGIDAVGKRYHS